MHLWSWLNSGTNHFNQADFCLPEMKKPTILSNKSDTALSCAEHQIFVGFLRINSSEQDFKYLYWTISKILLWNPKKNFGGGLTKKNLPGSTKPRHIFFDGYCSTVQGLLDWFEVDLGFTREKFTWLHEATAHFLVTVEKVRRHRHLADSAVCVLECVGVCWSVLKCVGSVLECVGVCWSVLKCWSVLHRHLADSCCVWGCLLECEEMWKSVSECVGVCWSALECEGVWGCVVKCVEVCWSVLECVGVYYIANLLIPLRLCWPCNTLQHTATHCNTLQHTNRAY